jgi:hypothetical protein
MDSTHETNALGWYLYNLTVRDERGHWMPVAHILTAREDSDVVAEALCTVFYPSNPLNCLRLTLTTDKSMV